MVNYQRSTRITSTRLVALAMLIGASDCAHSPSTLSTWKEPLSFPWKVSLASPERGESGVLGIAVFIENADSVALRRCLDDHQSSWTLRRLEPTVGGGRRVFASSMSDPLRPVILDDLEPGRYQLTVQAMGYYVLKRRIVLRPAKRDTLVARLVRFPQCLIVRAVGP